MEEFWFLSDYEKFYWKTNKSDWITTDKPLDQTKILELLLTSTS